MAHDATVDLTIPVRNERARLEAGVLRLQPYLEEIDARLTIVDNGSTDDTAQIGRRLAAQYDRVEYRRIEVVGKGAAIRAGWTAALASIVAFTDIDVAAPPSQLAAMLAPLREDVADVVVATRRHAS